MESVHYVILEWVETVKEGLPEINILPITYPTLNAPTPIRLRAHLAILPLEESIVMLASGDFSASESGTDLEGFGGRDR